MAVGQRFVKARLTVNESDWTPVVPPSDMDYLAIRCEASAIKIRTDPDDANTEDEIPAGIQDGVASSNTSNYVGHEHARWRRRSAEDVDVACYLQSPAGQGEQTVILTWVL